MAGTEQNGACRLNPMPSTSKKAIQLSHGSCWEPGKLSRKLTLPATHLPPPSLSFNLI